MWFSRNYKKICRMTSVLLVMALAVSFTGCSHFQLRKEQVHSDTRICKKAEQENKRFQEFTKQLFCDDISSNTISLHYTLRHPEKYDLHVQPATFGTYESDADAVNKTAESICSKLLAFDYDLLSRENKITYDILDDRWKLMKRSTEFMLYEEPLGIISGAQTQVPVVLSEYQFYEEKDVKCYLELLKDIGNYFDQILVFEKEKAAAGLLMSDEAIDQVIKQCQDFLSMGDGNYLFSTFSEKVENMSMLNEKEKSDYIKENALTVSDYVSAAYERMISGLEELKGCGKNEKGLVYLPKGKEYYELLVQKSTGSKRSIEEMEDLTRRQIDEDLKAMEQVMSKDQSLSSSAVDSDRVSSEPVAEQILEYLKRSIKNSFPDIAETKLKIKYVPKAMEPHLSPAFYMVPAIDQCDENTIYINPMHMHDDRTLFTTLAHEGYPGHLYQTMYYEATKPDPIRKIMDFGGYVEGWATYAEMGSYYLMGLPKEQAILLQKNASIMLALYALADMGIHYDGWGRMETIRFFQTYGIKNAEAIDQIFNLIIGSPANYLKYYIGYVEFLQLKKEILREKGEAFSQKEFHEGVLRIGPAPFDILNHYIRWEMRHEN